MHSILLNMPTTIVSIVLKQIQILETENRMVLIKGGKAAILQCMISVAVVRNTHYCAAL
jgi:hypothetical protein